MENENGILEFTFVWKDGYLGKNMACSCTCHENGDEMCRSCLLEHINKQAD